MNFFKSLPFIYVTDYTFQTFQILTDGLKKETIDNIDLIISTGNIMVKNKDVEKIEQVYQDLLLRWNDTMRVFKMADAPDYLRVKHAKYAHDILIIPRNRSVFGADPNHPNLYFPPSSGNVDGQDQGGSHGFEDISENYEVEGNFPDVRAIFMAMGPNFKANHSHPWIKLVDEYQVWITIFVQRITVRRKKD